MDDPDLHALLGFQAAASAQFEAAARDIAAQMAAFKAALLLAGFSVEAAERMTCDYFQAMILAAFRPAT